LTIFDLLREGKKVWNQCTESTSIATRTARILRFEPLDADQGVPVKKPEIYRKTRSSGEVNSAASVSSMSNDAKHNYKLESSLFSF